VKPRLKGTAYEIRFADDAVLCFQYREDAEKVMEVLPKRFAKYGLTLHPEKTRLVEFGRFAEERAKRRGKKPATFDSSDSPDSPFWRATSGLTQSIMWIPIFPAKTQRSQFHRRAGEKARDL